MKNLSEKTVGFIVAIAAVLVTGAVWFGVTQYQAAAESHQKVELLFNQLLVATQQGGALSVTDTLGDGSTRQRAATRLDILVAFAEQAAAGLKAQNDQQKAQAPAKPEAAKPDGGK